MKTSKWHWGKSIALVYSGFVLMILLLVGGSMGVKTDLVADDYYEQELVYQQKIEKSRRAAALTEPPTWQVAGQAIELCFPGNLKEKKLGGLVHFYCPSDRSRDKIVPIDGSAVLRIPLSELRPGRYRVRVDWRAGDTTYWNEGVITI